MAQTSPPTDQRAGVRPIAFAIDAGGILSQPVSLKVRPEDLTRTEPSRLTVHQTLGHGGTAGWVDNFGAGLPTLTISGHTGWRANGINGEDGAQAFETLNSLVSHEYHAWKQAAIDSGMDPASVKLLFIDMLDGFAWSVAPTSFVLRRSKSRPLLFQYNIGLQAVDTAIDSPFKLVPQLGGVTAGLESLTGAIAALEVATSSIKSLVESAVSYVDSGLLPIANVIKSYVAISLHVYRLVGSAVAAVQNGFTSVANRLIGIAGDLAKIGVNVFRTISAIANLPNDIKHKIMRVGSAFNEVSCILSNSLRPRKTYDNYDGMFGASNCSSTTGGRPDSPYANVNAFKLMQPTPDPLRLGTAAQSSSSILRASDPVLAPMLLQEVSRHLGNVVDGVEFA